MSTNEIAGKILSDEARRVRALPRGACLALYADVLASQNIQETRFLCLNDLYFLLTQALNRFDMLSCHTPNWLFDRVREVEADPDGHLDLWPREHYKSTVITFGLTISDILNDPEVTVGIFSHTKPVARAFLSQIKSELERNDFLKSLFPDVLYARPETESPRWSMNEGIVVRRKSNPKESTVEASGLVDGQPTSKHYSRLVYDDVVTLESISTPDQIKKTTDAWAMSLNLGAKGGKVRYIGTRYHMNDTYREMMDRQAVVPRVYRATGDGSPEGASVFLSQADLDRKRKEMGPYIFGSQMLQNPVADAVMGFKADWIQFYELTNLDGRTGLNTRGWNTAILVDPANSKRKRNDYTTMLVIGWSPDGMYYLLDGIRDRMNLTERTSELFRLARKWPRARVGYEQYGMQSDIGHIQSEMETQNWRFALREMGGQMAKEDRIRRLVPIFEQGQLWLPRRLLFKDRAGKFRDLVREFVDEEYASFPVSSHDDMLDCMSRIFDVGVQFPQAVRGRDAPQVKPAVTVHEYKVL